MKRLMIIIMLLLVTIGNSAGASPTASEKQLLNKIAKKTFMYFWKEANPKNGLIRDATTNQNASVSVIGFGLAGICIAVENGWITRNAGYERVLTTLRSFSAVKNKGHQTRVANEQGHPYHWVSTFDGSWPSVGGIFATDTAVFLAGVITAGEYFKGTEVSILADAIYQQVNWQWFFNAKQNSLYLGWTPKGGHFGYYQMNKIGLLATLLAISSPTQPIPASAWFTLGHRFFHVNFKDYQYFGDGAAYTHQWPFCFIDPRLRKDYFADYGQNNREFALASRQWCIDHRGEGYGPNLWGLSVAQGPDKYGKYGAPVINNAPLYYNGQDNDGTVTPAASIGFLPFTPERSMAVINHLYSNYREQIFNQYGFTDSINTSVDYFSADYLGINQGSSLLMIDNYLNGTVWKYFGRNRYVKAGLKKIGLVGIIDNFDPSQHSQPYAKWQSLTNGVTVKTVNHSYKEGRQALAVTYKQPSQPIKLSVDPRKKELANYSYLGMWHSGAEKVSVSLRGAKQGIYKLKLVDTVRDGNWELSYFKLPNLKSRLINSTVLTLTPAAANRSPVIYLDYLHLSNKQFLEKPTVPNHVEAIPGKHSGEIILSWQTMASKVALAGYQIKYADQPFAGKSQFNQSNNTVSYRGIIQPGQHETTISGLEPGQKYYFGISAVNPVYVGSALGMTSITTPSKETLIFDFNPKELTTKNLDGWEYFQSSGDQLEVIHIAAETGYAKELNYVSDESGQAWFGLKKSVEGRIKKSHHFKLKVKGSGLTTKLEFKLITASGAVFGKEIEFVPYDNRWHELTIAANELRYWWGGDGNAQLDYIDQIELVFTTDAPGRGRIAVNHLRARWK